MSDTASVGSISACGSTITWTVGGLADGASATATITVEVHADSGTITNTATESQTTADPTGTQTASAAVSPLPAANVSISKTVPNATPADGTDLTYTLKVSNAGPDTAAGVSVSDPLPAGLTCVSDTASVGSISGCGPTITWTVGSLANGATATATITVEVNADSGTITNTATETQTTADPTGVQTSSVPIQPTPAANVSISKTVSDATPADGSDVTYTLKLNNAGPDAAAGVAVSDPLPFGTTFVSSSTATGSLSNPAVGTNGTVTWTVGTLSDGSTATGHHRRARLRHRVPARSPTPPPRPRRRPTRTGTPELVGVHQSTAGRQRLDQKDRLRCEAGRRHRRHLHRQGPQRRPVRRQWCRRH